MKKSFPGSPCLTIVSLSSKLTGSRASATVSRSHLSKLSRIDTLDRNSSYIFRFRIVDPIKILRYESRSIPQSFTSVLARTLKIENIWYEKKSKIQCRKSYCCSTGCSIDKGQLSKATSLTYCCNQFSINENLRKHILVINKLLKIQEARWETFSIKTFLLAILTSLSAISFLPIRHLYKVNHRLLFLLCIRLGGFGNKEKTFKRSSCFSVKYLH